MEKNETRLINLFKNYSSKRDEGKKYLLEQPTLFAIMLRGKNRLEAKSFNTRKRDLCTFISTLPAINGNHRYKQFNTETLKKIKKKISSSLR